MKYRADIDGLRAIAVLSVLAYHYGAPISGGFTGVDVFFVISGYLITSNLYSDIEHDKFSVLNFYDRRVRRILPALAVMLCGTLLLGRWLLFPGDYQSLALSTAAAAFGVSNFYFLAHTGYFDQVADLMPLLHTWSLGVEEQFYVVWPLLLIAIAKSTRKASIAAIIAAAVVIGFEASLIWFNVAPKEAFFNVAPRAWELAVGALLVFVVPLSRSISNVATLAGILIIVAGFFQIDAAKFPSFAAMVPCAGAALVIWPRKQTCLAAELLGKLHPIGLISYSLYLWHWPIWVMYRIYSNNAVPRYGEAVVLAAVSIAVATLSYVFVEKPFRAKRWPSAKTVQAAFAVSMTGFCFAMFIDSSNGLPGRLPADAIAMSNGDVMWNWKCPYEMPIDSHLDWNECVLGVPWNKARAKGILWGDSHAEHLAPFLDLAAKKLNVSLALFRECPPIVDDVTVQYRNPDHPRYNQDCAIARRSILERLRDSDASIVILAARWSAYTPTVGFTPAVRAQTIRDGMDALLGELQGYRVIVVADTPSDGVDHLACALAATPGFLRRRCKPPSINAVEARSIASQDTAALKAVASEYNATFLDPMEAMCNKLTSPLYYNHEYIFRDEHHFRRNLRPKTVRAVERQLGLEDVLAHALSPSAVLN